MDSKLNYRQHLKAKCTQIHLKLRELSFLIGKSSKLSIFNKLLLCKLIIKPIWSHGIDIWSTANASNIKTLTTLQNKILRNISKAPWYVPNNMMQADLQIDTVETEIRRRSLCYTNISSHENMEIRSLPHTEANNSRRLRLRRFRTSNLSASFI